jgi:hypothetical protein
MTILYRLADLWNNRIPKMIRTDKQMMVNSALATGDFFELSPGDKAFIVCPRNTLLGKMMLVRSFILGLDRFCCTKFTSIDKE